MCTIQMRLCISQVLNKVDALRKKVVSVGKEHASLCAKVGSYLKYCILLGPIPVVELVEIGVWSGTANIKKN